MTDWYFTETGLHRAHIGKDGMERGFRNRTVIGGIFIKLLEYRGIMSLS